MDTQAIYSRKYKYRHHLHIMLLNCEDILYMYRKVVHGTILAGTHSPPFMELKLKFPELQLEEYFISCDTPYAYDMEEIVVDRFNGNLERSYNILDHEFFMIGSVYTISKASFIRRLATYVAEKSGEVPQLLPDT